jgi:2-amino-4-hydroxy-6-hydroxymethyldihydropteridine diphosphokinase
MGDVIILLGSNIEPAMNIRSGALNLASMLTLRQTSSVWLTPAIGTTEPDFYNAAVLCTTDLDKDSLKFSVLRPIEEKMGRVRTLDKYAARIMDLDAIIINGIVLEPRVWDTAFILLPVAELKPDLIDPKTGKNLRQLADLILPACGAIKLPDFPLFV